MDYAELTPEQLQARKDWVADLRSGNFAQTYGLLRHTDEDGKSSYCCWGVLCNRVDPNAWDEPLDSERKGISAPALQDGDRVWAHEGTRSAFYAPDEVLDLVGMSENAGRGLATANDNGHSFASIADMIYVGDDNSRQRTDGQHPTGMAARTGQRPLRHSQPAHLLD